MSEKFLIVSFSDGTSWRIPAKIIAHDRASYFAQKDYDRHGGNYQAIEIYNGELEFTLEDDFELIDWARNNMDWSDVMDHAVKVGEVLPDYEKGWVNADMRVEVTRATLVLTSCPS